LHGRAKSISCRSLDSPFSAPSRRSRGEAALDNADMSAGPGGRT
jgi:hypothetical protein